MTDLPPNAKAWHTHDKSEWEPGPWIDEPDKVSWTDEETGRPCLIHRGPSGALCGYVAVDPGHPLHGKSYYTDDGEEVASNVHGGLTYASACQETDDESEGICHVPEPGAPDDVWWFGFDCAHSGDVSPAWLHYGSGRFFADAEYRGIGYVVAECQNLAKQLAA